MESDLLIPKIPNSLPYQPDGELAGIVYLGCEIKSFPSETKLLATL